MVLVVPRGVGPRRHFGSSAIALALYLYGALGKSAVETGARVGLFGTSDSSCLRTLSCWAAAARSGSLFARLRLAPSDDPSPRRDARRIAHALIALIPSSEGSPEERAFAGGVLAA